MPDRRSPTGCYLCWRCHIATRQRVCAPEGHAACSCAFTSSLTSSGTSAVATELPARCPPAGASIIAGAGTVSWADTSWRQLVSLWLSSRHHGSEICSICNPAQLRCICLRAWIGPHVARSVDADRMTAELLCDVTTCSTTCSIRWKVTYVVAFVIDCARGRH